MDMLKKLIDKYNLSAYFLLTFIWSFAIWSLLFLIVKPFSASGNLPVGFYVIYFIGCIGPSLAGFLIKFFTDGIDGIKDLANSAIQFKPVYLLNILIFCVPIIVCLSTMHFFNLLGKNIAVNYYFSIIIPALFIGLISGLMEEFGWRGSLQQRLQNKFNPIVTSLIIGGIWGLWNFIPAIFFIPGSGFIFILSFILLYPLMLSGYSIIISIIYNKSKGSLLFVVLFHAFMTASSIVFNLKSSNPFEYLYIVIFQTVILWVIVSVLLSIFGLDLGLDTNKIDDDIT